MAVRPDHHGRGYGDLLLNAAERWALRKGATEILNLSNTLLGPAIALNKSTATKRLVSGHIRITSVATSR